MKGSELYNAHCGLVEELKTLFMKLQNGNTLDGVQFQRLFTIAMLDVASVLAVDSLMTEEQFVKVCTETFKVAYDKAPKFG